MRTMRAEETTRLKQINHDSDGDYQSEEIHGIKKRTQTILWSRELWFDD
jgi:hypothetical protein